MSELMETALVTAEVDDDQQEVAQKVARYDLLAIPVVDADRKMRGIITHDDVIDVMQEEATADAHRAGAVAPLTLGYLETRVLTLVWKRGIWLIVLFGAALLTAFLLREFEPQLENWKWLVAFLPLIISCGGNSGNQSATLVITGLRTNDIELADWTRLLRREVTLGLLLGLFLAACGLLTVYVVNPQTGAANWVVPLTILCVVLAGSLVGSVLPLVFQRIGWDPALMSNPFVACIVDLLGIAIYMSVAWLLLRGT
jgi:magnesium transporter